MDPGTYAGADELAPRPNIAANTTTQNKGISPKMMS